MAAVLACWPDALLSHVSGGVLLALLDKDDHYPHVTAAGRGGRSRRAIHLHRPRALHPEDRASRDGIPVTSVSRTLVDLAGMLDERRLRRAFDQADRLYLLNLPALQRACERARGRRGIGVLRALVADYRPAARTRSELEDLFLDLCREYRLPHPAVNIRVTGYEVDAYWPDAKLVVELDGFEFHRTRAAFEQDRLRDAELKLAGIEVIRVTAAWIRRDPRSVAETVRRMLALRAPAGPS
jgi:very-short-patch-repair endonuclease